MKYTFTEISSSLDGQKIILDLFDHNKPASCQVKIDWMKLVEMYPREFMTFRKVPNGNRDSPPEYMPTNECLSLPDWYDEYLKGKEEKAWDIWNKVSVLGAALIEQTS